MKVLSILKKISQELSVCDAKAIVVGGVVRDYFLKQESKDIDVEVYNISSLDELEKILNKFGKVNHVGKSFGVLKLSVKEYEFDFSLPRVEKKVGKAHRDFEVKSDGKLSYKDAFKRRDFTINAIGYDIESGEFIDEFGGISDIKKKILKEVDAKTFVEDSLRVYRAVQFSARFGFSLSEGLKNLCTFMVESGELDYLPKERVFEEIKKLLLKSSKPSVGFMTLRELGILERYFPELDDLIGVKQERKYHPEGDVFTHTLLALDALKERDLVLKLAILCHDMGKAVCTKEVEGRIRSIGHEEAGVEIAERFLRRLTDDKKLVRWHFAPSAFYEQNSKSKAIRRLALKVDIKSLVKVAEADFKGRGDDTQEFKAGEWLLKRAEELNVKDEPIKPLVSGKDLINLGIKPSKEMGEILKKLYDLQLDEGIENREELLKNILVKYPHDKK